MLYKARDGRKFGNVIQGRKYDRSLDEQRVQTQVDRGREDIENAPGGPQHEHDLREHGIALESTVKYDGPGRWKHVAVHSDGYKAESVHPEAYRAHEVQAKYLAIEPPPAIQTHSKARSYPTGPKEAERIAKEDGRDDDAARYEDFEG